MIRVLLIDNFDSFTYNLAHGFAEAGADEVVVRRNDAITVAEAVALAPTHLVISPGPGTPDQTGVSADLIGEFAGQIPILGVCLGHQLLVQLHEQLMAKA
ncbi:MAG: anthranilate/aminodeoxychorismate synthase component II, partial [Thermoleophilia bacterium]